MQWSKHAIRAVKIKLHVSCTAASMLRSAKLRGTLDAQLLESCNRERAQTVNGGRPVVDRSDAKRSYGSLHRCVEKAWMLTRRMGSCSA